MYPFLIGFVESIIISLIAVLIFRRFAFRDLEKRIGSLEDREYLSMQKCSNFIKEGYKTINDLKRTIKRIEKKIEKIKNKKESKK